MKLIDCRCLHVEDTDTPGDEKTYTQGKESPAAALGCEYPDAHKEERAAHDSVIRQG